MYGGNTPILKLRVVEFFSDAKRHHMIFVFPDYIEYLPAKLCQQPEPRSGIGHYLDSHSTRFPERKST